MSNKPDWLDDRSKVERAIAGAIKDAILTHGPIDKTNLASAVKRVYGTLKGLRKTFGHVPPPSPDQRELYELDSDD